MRNLLLVFGLMSDVSGTLIVSPCFVCLLVLAELKHLCSFTVRTVSDRAHHVHLPDSYSDISYTADINLRPYLA
jgi:hypothetical protein